MADQPYFKQKLETLEYPENMRSVVALAEKMFEDEQWYGGQHLTDGPESSRLYWEADHGVERLALNVMDGALIFAIENGSDSIPSPFLTARRASLSIAMGKGIVSMMDPSRPVTYSDGLMQVNEPPVSGDFIVLKERKKFAIQSPYDYSAAFRIHLNHTMALIGLNYVLAS